MSKYFGPGRADLLTRAAMAALRRPLQRWDVRTARNPHHFVANSENVRQQIQRIYHRPADVIYPPVETARFAVSSRDDGYYLVVSALVPYKRVDLAVRTASRAGERLVVVGDGPEMHRLRSIAGATVEFVGWRPDEEIREYETAAFEELKISPIPVPVPEVVASLNTGLINANVGPAPWVLGTQAYLSYKYYIEQPLSYAPAVQISKRNIFEDRFRGKYPEGLIYNFICTDYTKEGIFAYNYLLQL